MAEEHQEFLGFRLEEDTPFKEMGEEFNRATRRGVKAIIVDMTRVRHMPLGMVAELKMSSWPFLEAGGTLEIVAQGETANILKQSGFEENVGRVRESIHEAATALENGQSFLRLGN